MKITFFGDSFSAENSKFNLNFKTYISLLETEFNTKISIKSKGGCSHWDIIINQFLPETDNLPEVCIFTWPDENRFFHRTVRNIRLNEAVCYSEKKYKILEPGYNFGMYKNEWRAAEMFYKYLFDRQKNDLEYRSSLLYFDEVILKNFSNKKFIHLWSFNKKHEWKNTVALDEPLITMAERLIPNYHEPNYLEARNKNYEAPNHLPTQELNDHVFEKVRDLVYTVIR